MSSFDFDLLRRLASPVADAELSPGTGGSMGNPNAAEGGNADSSRTSSGVEFTQDSRSRSTGPAFTALADSPAAITDIEQHESLAPSADAVSKWSSAQLSVYVRGKVLHDVSNASSNRFEALDFPGRLYLTGTSATFWKDLEMPPGPAMLLAQDVNLIVQCTKSDDTIQFRKQSADSVELAPSTRAQVKRAKLDSFSILCQAAARIKKSLKDLPDTTDFSAPEIMELPFPSVHQRFPGSRFSLSGTTGKWTYLGRSSFKKLEKDLNLITLKSPSFDEDADAPITETRLRWKGLWIQGTAGYGKSSLLAALTCKLLKRGKRVVYLPNCFDFLDDPVYYIRDAFVLAWSGDEQTLTEISYCTTQNHLSDFVAAQAQADKQIHWIYDQCNAFKSETPLWARPVEPNPWVTEHHRWLQNMSGQGIQILCSSSSHIHPRKLQLKEPRWIFRSLTGGFNEEEADAYWKWRSPETSADVRRNIDDRTGRVPQLVGRVIDDGLDINFLTKDIYGQVRGFINEIWMNAPSAMGLGIRELHMSFLRTCLLDEGGQAVGSEMPVNNRYFYVDTKGNAGATCPLAMEAAFRYLRSKRSDLVTCADLLAVIRAIPRNPSVAGFAIEGAALSAIAQGGIDILNHEKTEIKMRGFAATPLINKSILGSILHYPEAYNFPAVDAVLTSTFTEQDPTTNLLTLVCRISGLQITLSPNSHSNSEAGFLKVVEGWIEANHLTQGCRIDLDLVWIGGTENSVTPIASNSLLDPPQHRAFNRIRRTFKNISPGLHDALVEGGLRHKVEASSPTAGQTIAAWTVPMLKAELKRRNVSMKGRTRKVDLVDLRDSLAGTSGV